MRERFAGFVLLALAMTITACGGQTPSAAGSQSPAPVSPTAAATAEGSPTPGGTFRIPTVATITVSGSVDLPEMSLLGRGFDEDPEFTGYFRQTYSDSANTLVISLSADVDVGTFETGRVVIVSFQVRQPDDRFVSQDGECTVEFTQVAQPIVTGTFACDAVPSEEGDGSIDMSGEFRMEL